MESEKLVAQILSDISVLREQIRHSQEDETPEIVLVYLLANYHLIEFCLKQSYKSLDEARRLDLCKSHRELEPTAASNDFLSIAELALVNTKNYWIANKLYQIDDDDLNMLWRGLAFAQYAPISLTGMTLLLHPVEDYLPLKKQ